MCDCCGLGSVEVKCPYCVKDDTIKDVQAKKQDLLEMVQGNLHLAKGHAYYQVQTQIHALNVKYADFVVWTQKDIFVERIFPDALFCSECLQKANVFFKKCILPELIGKFYSRPATADLKQHTDIWCYCRGAEEEQQTVMKCDNDTCLLQWFHFDCLHMTKKPKGRWYCPECRKLDITKKRNNKKKGV